MDHNNSRRGEYYRTISREFLRKRGAPFDLSPRDLTLIADWERREVPLDAVLEGLRAAFEYLRGRPRKGKRVTLTFCAGFVDRAAAQSRDRKVGRRRVEGSRKGKILRAREEVERFLGDLPSGGSALSGFFRRGLAALSAGQPDEEVLDLLDDEVDAALWDKSSPEERENGKRISLIEFSGKTPDDIDAIVRTTLIRGIRDKHKIPYMSLYYY